MNSTSGGIGRIAAALAPFALALAAPAHAQTASAEIIPLPLNPVVGTSEPS